MDDQGRSRKEKGKLYLLLQDSIQGRHQVVLSARV